MRSPGWALIQSDRDPYRTQTHEERGPGRTPPCPRLDLGLQPPGAGDHTCLLGEPHLWCPLWGPRGLRAAQNMLGVSNRKEGAGQSFGKPVFLFHQKGTKPTPESFQTQGQSGQRSTSKRSRCTGWDRLGWGRARRIPSWRMTEIPLNSLELVGHSSAHVT